MKKSGEIYHYWTDRRIENEEKIYTQDYIS